MMSMGTNTSMRSLHLLGDPWIVGAYWRCGGGGGRRLATYVLRSSAYLFTVSYRGASEVDIRTERQREGRVSLIKRGNRGGTGRAMTAYKDVLVEINPMPPPRTRLQFVNMGTSSPRLELEDGTVYVGEFQDMMGSVLVFRETQVTDATAGEREDQASDGIHEAMMARLEEAQAREQGGGARVGAGGRQDQGLSSQGGAKAKQGGLGVETVTALEGVANVKLVFTLRKS